MTDQATVHQGAGVTLREYLDARLDGLGALMAAQAVGHAALHASEGEAVALARSVQTHKDERANALRSQIESERGLYMTRDAVDARLATAIADYQRLAERNATRIAVLEQAQSNLVGRLWAYGSALVFAVTLLALAMKFL